jgi:hypothetical protein
MTIYKFCMEIEVTHVAKLEATALYHLTYKDGMDLDDAKEMIYPEGPETDPDIEACLRAILDPGSSPSGTRIHGSFTE